MFDPGGVEGMFMTRTGTAIGIIIFALFLIAATQPATAQVEQTPTDLVTVPDAATPWEAEEGDETEANIRVDVCWSQPGINAQEGNILVDIELPSDTPELSMRFDDEDDAQLTFVLPQYDLGPQGDDDEVCVGAQTVNLFIELLQEFDEESHTHTFTFEFTTSNEGDTGTFSVPDGGSDSVDVEIVKPEDAIGGDDTEEEEETTTTPDTEESPAPAFAVFTVLGFALLATLRRRQ